MKTLRIVFSLLIVISAWAPAFAGDEAIINKLVRSRTRPTIGQVLETLKELGYPDVNPFDDDAESRAARTEGFEQAMPYLADFISGLEANFPGGVWVPLGRDAVQLGDGLDAFYTAIGQPDRVSRLNGSGFSVRRKDPKDLLRFAESAGLNLDLIAKGRARPFVIFDNTSFSTSSQSYEIVDAIWDEAQRRGITPEVLVRMVGTVAIGGSSRRSPLYLETIRPNPEAAFRQQIKGNGSPVPGKMFQSTIYSNTGNLFAYTTMWHDTFGKLAVQPNGKFEGTPPANAFKENREYRRMILADLYELIRLTSRPKFLEMVQESARESGFEFVAGRRRASYRFKPAPKLGVRAIGTDLRNLVIALPPVGERNDGYSASAAQLAEWLPSNLNRSENRASTLGLFLRASAKAYDQDKIGNRDFRRLVAVALESADPYDTDFQEQFALALKAAPSLVEILVKKSDFFVGRSEKFGESVAEKYELLRKGGLIPADCGEVLNPKRAA